jgi:DNA repair exonuclease SbcCD ATPase subunit
MDAALATRIDRTRYTIDATIIKDHEFEVRSIARLHAKLKALEDEKVRLVKALALIDKTIDIVAAKGIGRVESIVTGGLHAIWGKDSKLRFVIDKKESARGYNYELLMSKGDFTGKIMESFGGSVQNIVSFLLRVILIKRFHLAKFIALDETFANIGNEKGHHYLEKSSAMLKDLCDNHGFTIMAVTHQPLLSAAADHIYQLVAHPDAPPTLRELTKEELTPDSFGNAFDEANQTQIAG